MKLRNKIVALFLTVACAFGLAVANGATKVEAADLPENATAVATFEFGANGSASHNDGSEFSSKDFTADGYTLSITGASKVYSGARDAKGNSALKVGTGKATGTFKFTAPEDISYVAINVAGYKAATSTNVKVNGVQTNVKTASNNGAYTPIIVDTTSTKDIKFVTVTYRCMIDSIVYYTTSGEVVEKTDAEKLAIAKENLKLEATTVVTNISLPTVGDFGAEISWSSSDEGILDFEGYVERPVEDTVITLTATITLGDEVDTKEFQVTVKGFNRTKVNNPVAGTYYKLGVTQLNTKKDLFLTGDIDGVKYRLAGNEDASKGAYVYLEEVEGGFYLAVVVGETTKYINVVKTETSYINANYQDAAETVWTYNTKYNTLTAKFDGTDYYLGAYKEYNNFQVSKTSFLDEANSTSSAAYFVELTEAELEELNALKVKVGYQVGTKDEAKALRLVAELNLTAEDLEAFESTIAFRVTHNDVADERVVTTLYSSVNPMNDEAVLEGAYYAVLTYVNIPAGEYLVEVLVDGEVADTVTATVA